MHSINLGKYELRTDMAIDLIEKNESKIEQKISEENSIKTTYIKLYIKLLQQELNYSLIK